MQFPVVFHPFGLTLPAHLLFEVLAYSLGFQLFLFLRRREKAESVPPDQIAWILVGAIFGALFGSKLLAWLEHPQLYWSLRADPQAMLAGKTIVGGLLGGWIGVEIAKKLQHIHTRTGDAYVLPLIVGIAVGRIGCFLTGLADMTHGIATSLPWGVDFGDGVRRHPTQLYEIVFLLLLGIAIMIRWQSSPLISPPSSLPASPNPHPEGEGTGNLRHPTGNLFRLFLAAYLLFRFAVEWIKPSPKSYAGFSAIQIASLIGAVVCIIQLVLARRCADRFSRSFSSASA